MRGPRTAWSSLCTQSRMPRTPSNCSSRYPAHDEVLDPTLSYEAYDAGHILGSSALVLHGEENGRKIRLAFSGDVGRPTSPLSGIPTAMPPVDYLIMESTYGDRLHKDLTAVADKLAEIVNRTCQRGGKIIVPAFAVGGRSNSCCYSMSCSIRGGFRAYRFSSTVRWRSK